MLLAESVFQCENCYLSNEIRNRNYLVSNVLILYQKIILI